MKKLIIVFVILTLVGCERQSSGSKKFDNNYRIRTIDGCEYIEFENGFKSGNNYSYSITHKGNCKNPTHKYKCD